MKRILYTGTLRFPAGFHTGDGRRLGAVDQPLFREADGEVALAGSSLAGALRADLEHLAAETAGPGEGCSSEPDCVCVVCRLMGPRAHGERRADREEVSLRASRLHVSGGRLEGARIRVRDRVGLDRRTRTAADKRKYDLELVEGGAQAPFELRLDDPRDDELAHLEAALRRLAAGWIFLGGKTSSGPGRVEVVELERHELDLGEPTALVGYLLADDPKAGATATDLLRLEGWLGGWEIPPPGAEPGGERPRPGRAQIRLSLELDFPWGFLVNSPAEALRQGFDQAFLRLGTGGRPVLPGSALKGSLRSRGEQILRTLGGGGAACDLNTQRASCHEKIRERSDEIQKSGGRRPDFDWELAEHCTACRVFGSGRLASSVRVTDFQPLPDRPGLPRPQELVAIDRFTGGAAEGAKFNAQSAAAVTFAGEIHLEVGRDRLQGWGLGLLALILRDLLLGDIPLGFGSGKGSNEYTARITAADRFWLRAPETLANEVPWGDAGSAGWRPAEGQALDRPAAVARLAGEDLERRLQRWVGELHAFLGPQPAPSGGSPDASA